MRISTVLVTLTTVLAISFLVKLGLWQLDRAADKQALFDDFAAAQAQADELKFNPLFAMNEEPERYQPVQVTGQFLDDYLLLDNQVYQGKVGYHVIGLLRTEQRPELVPVNLGWVPVGLDRTKLPQLELPNDVLTVKGWFYQPNTDGFSLAKRIVEPNGPPWRIQQLDSSAISDALELPIATNVVLLSEAEAYGWLRSWQPQVMSPEKHQAYALQWFSLALALLIVVLLVRRSITKTKKEGT
ncbi:SURF1 family protein [Pseudidiomarina homiensis]|uniref:SURF1 family protein n=1 Tax=Pseudidiomarina homiensis TaxID=364198 RepID=UPI00215A91EB|nr:SURF1 family protein [Pseudidiomarina homiensis]